MKTESQFDLSPRRIRFFRDRGYLRIDRISTDEEIGRLRTLFDSIIEQLRRNPQRGEYVDAFISSTFIWVHTPERVHPEFLDTVLVKNARRMAARLLDVESAQVETSLRLFYKPALKGSETPWHQDAAYKSPYYDARSLNVWMPLDPVSRDGPCLQFIPRSHKGDVRHHRQIQSDPTGGVALTTDDVDLSQAVACAVPVGGATFHHCRTLHYSGPNVKGRARRALTVVCEAPPVKRATPANWSWQNWAGRSWPNTNF